MPKFRWLRFKEWLADLDVRELLVLSSYGVVIVAVVLILFLSVYNRPRRVVHETTMAQVVESRGRYWYVERRPFPEDGVVCYVTNAYGGNSISCVEIGKSK